MAVLFRLIVFALAAQAAIAQPGDKAAEFEAAAVKVNVAGPDGAGGPA